MINILIHSLCVLGDGQVLSPDLDVNEGIAIFEGVKRQVVAERGANITIVEKLFVDELDTVAGFSST